MKNKDLKTKNQASIKQIKTSSKPSKLTVDELNNVNGGLGYGELF
ncbi:MAG: hypothetical protein AAFQ91_29750 [Cyanobacteria bacterium J06621_15]